MASELASDGDRPACQYGIKCYRQNPQHFIDYSHPAGHKRSQEESDGDDDQPGPSGDATAGVPVAQDIKRKRKEDDASSTPKKKRGRARTQVENSGASKSEVSALGLYLTTAREIDSKYNSPLLTRSMKNILAPEMGNLQSSVQFNYMFDIPWIMDQYPPEFKDKPILLIHGYSASSSSGTELRNDASAYPNITLAMARLPMQYGTHHTKMMILRYDVGVRVVVHTSNLISGDWNNKTQGIWISPLFPKNDSPGDSETNFRADLVEYLRSYNVPALTQVSNQLLEYDMSQAKVCIVGSTPGRHTGPKKPAFGHLKLRSLLTKHCSAMESDWPVIGQFSSIGSLGSTAASWLTGEFLESLSSPISGLTRRPPLNLIFPSVDNVRFSLEGWSGGGSLPYSEDTANKQRYLDKFFHANLSKAAWGALEKDASQLMIRSYELGVLFVPRLFDPSSVSFGIKTDVAALEDQPAHDALFLPYDLPLTEYAATDKPWTWNAPQPGLKDRFGKTRGFHLAGFYMDKRHLCRVRDWLLRGLCALHRLPRRTCFDYHKILISKACRDMGDGFPSLDDSDDFMAVRALSNLFSC